MTTDRLSQLVSTAIENRDTATLQQLRQRLDLDPESAQLLADEALLSRLLPPWQAAVPQINVADSVIRALHSKESTRPNTLVMQSPAPRRSSALPVWIGAVASAAALVLVSVALKQGSQSAHPQHEVASKSTSPDFTPAPMTDADRALQRAGASTVILAHRTATSLSDTVVTIMPGSPSLRLESDPAHPSFLDRWRKNLEPIGSRIEDAVQGFFGRFQRQNPSSLIEWRAAIESVA